MLTVMSYLHESFSIYPLIINYKLQYICHIIMNNSDQPEFIKKGRGVVLLWKGHQYYKNRVYAAGSTIWRCTQRKCGSPKFACTGSITTQDGLVIKSKSHNKDCIIDYGKNEIHKKIYECKKELATSDFSESVNNIYKRTEKSLRDSGLDIISKVPKFNSIKNSLFAARNKGAGISKISFEKPENVEISPRYSDFMLGDYNSHGVRVIVFCDPALRHQLNSIEHIFGDGTFKSCPPPFKQIYVIYGDFNSTARQTNVFPIIYAFMSEMTELAYRILFGIIKSQLQDWQPKKITTDFENAPRLVMAKLYPDTIPKGCLFHFKNSIRRKGHQIGLMKNKWTKHIVLLSCVLPMLPRDKIMEGWEYVKGRISIINEILPYENQINQFVSYMEKTWLKSDKYIDVWCVSSERHRTSNYAEGWNQKLNNICRKRRKTNIMQILQVLRDDAQDVVADLKKIKEGQNIKPRSHNSFQNDVILLNFTLDLMDGKICSGHFMELMK